MNQRIHQVLIWLFLFGITANSFAADEQHKPFSMAISGGASKGAYEAGLNWGLLKILRDVELTPGGQGRVFEAASFSGASAGGINTLLSGLGWCSLPESQGGLADRIDSNIFRDVWLIPDVNRLLPPTSDSVFYKPDDALLSRHDLLQASQLLREKWNKPIFRQGCRIPLGVTVTRVIPETLSVGNIQVRNQRLFIPFEARTQKNGTLDFYFDPSDYPRMSDPAMILMPRSKNEPAFSIADQQVEDAVLTSAAYPGGFGRKRLLYCRHQAHIPETKDKDEKQERPPDAKTTFICPDNYELAEAEFADGGLFDNLPVGLARNLAEQHKHANDNPLPVTYMYLDPNRLRYKVPTPEDTSACASEKPPEACQIMEFSFFTEHALLLDALGTARKYELYRELTSDYWALNLAQISYSIADQLNRSKVPIYCQEELPFFTTSLNCAESLRRSAALLELAYVHNRIPITSPFSAEKLKKSGIIEDCRVPSKKDAIQSKADCRINLLKYRYRLANSTTKIVNKIENIDPNLIRYLNRSRFSLHNDRILRVTSRGAPITGTLLSDFGAFLDLKFREYDYYVGVYDAAVAASETICSLQFSEKHQTQEYIQCRDALSLQTYKTFGVQNDARARYVFARLAEWEFGNRNLLKFAYDPMPEEDRDMRIIFDGLIKALEAGEQSEEIKQAAFFTEDNFFLHLNNEGFEPTPTEDGTTPLLAQIMADPTKWSSELVRRMTSRIVYLEREAEKIYVAREPDPEKRETAHTTLMGMTAHSLQTATYNYPSFTFAPSTAPESWGWRYLIPYEAAFDLADGDIILTWQPTWSLSDRDLVGIRASLGFAGGVFDSSASETRENYGALGLDYTRRTGKGDISSWGITPTWFHTWQEGAFEKQDSFGGDVHVSFFKDRLRIGLGARNFSDASDTWFLTIGLTDLPGLTYWLTR